MVLFFLLFNVKGEPSDVVFFQSHERRLIATFACSYICRLEKSETEEVIRYDHLRRRS